MASLTTTQWQAVLAEIAREVSPGSFQTWFRNIELIAIEGARVQLGVPNLFMKEWIREHYLPAISRALRTVTGAEPEVSIGISPRLFRSSRQESLRELAPEGAARSEAPAVGPAAPAAPGAGAARPGSDWGARLNRNLVLESFVAGGCNRLAVDAAQAVIESPGAAYNPLVIHGGAGLGKTHLLQALCDGLRQARPGAAVLYLSCEEFTNAYITAVQSSALHAFRGRCRGADCLAIDDIEFLGAKEHTQEEFFHTFDALLHAGRQVVVAASRHPRELSGLSEKLRTRLMGGLVAQLQPPDIETRRLLVRSKAARWRLELADEVVELVAGRASSSVRELEGAVAALAAAARADGRPPDGIRARAVLRQLAARCEGPPAIDDILRAVSGRFGVPVEELRLAGRTRRVMVPRQVAMYLARKLAGLSLAEVGRNLGGRDHATVLYSERKVEAEMAADPALRTAVEELSSELRG